MPSRPLTELEICSILSNTDSIMHRCLIILGVRTGFRISELLSITIGDISKNGLILDTLTIKRRNMKGKASSRSVVLHEQVKEALREYLPELSGNSKLFPLSRFQAHRIIKRAVDRAGLQGRISCHSMRKAFGMKVYEVTGRNIVAAQRALGHKSLASTSHYLSVDQDIVDKAILSWDDYEANWLPATGNRRSRHGRDYEVKDWQRRFIKGDKYV